MLQIPCEARCLGTQNHDCRRVPLEHKGYSTYYHLWSPKRSLGPREKGWRRAATVREQPFLKMLKGRGFFERRNSYPYCTKRWTSQSKIHENAQFSSIFFLLGFLWGGWNLFGRLWSSSEILIISQDSLGNWRATKTTDPIASSLEDVPPCLNNSSYIEING